MKNVFNMLWQLVYIMMKLLVILKKSVIINLLLINIIGKKISFQQNQENEKKFRKITKMLD